MSRTDLRLPPWAVSARTGANAVVTGALLGVLQWGVLVWLSSYLSSTALVYLLSTAVWLVGSVAGLLAPGRRLEGAWLAAAMAAHAACRALAVAHPYDLSALPALLACVAVMGAYAGRFFRFRAPAFRKVKWLLFLENTGFVLGLLGAVLALFVLGERALVLLPWPLFAVALATIPGQSLDPVSALPPSSATGTSDRGA